MSECDEYVIKDCPICGETTLSRECVTYTTEVYCPKKWLGEMIHVECAQKEGLVTPKRIGDTYGHKQESKNNSGTIKS